ncbi:MAG: DnaJ domain-containing protein [Armatimonadetes bacterium]|nr:DnaJ domain-containing protein [Armatimonadota bacterium]
MSGGEPFDPYRVLGVPVGASKQQIRRQYRRLVRRLHPDLRRDDPKSHEEMVRLNRAYQMLMDDNLRAQWEAKVAAEMLGPLTMPGDPGEALERARKLFEQDRLEDAMMACADALDADPRSAEAYALLGRIYRRLGVDHLANEMFRQAQRIAGAKVSGATAGTGTGGGAPTAHRPEIWQPEPVKVRWAVLVLTLSAALSLLAGSLLSSSTTSTVLIALAGASFLITFGLAASGAVEPADAVLDEPVWDAYGRGAPLWLVLFVAGCVWGHLALIFYLAVGYLSECLRGSGAVFFLAVYGIMMVATALVPERAGVIWLVGGNAAVPAGIIGWMVGSTLSPYEWWRAQG